MYQKVPVTLTESQFHKMRSGKPIQLSHQQISGGAIHRHHLMLHPENVKKVAGAMRKQKGVRLTVSPHEFEASGEGIMDFFNKIKEGAQWLKSKVIDTPFYQQNVKPLVRGAVDAGLMAVAPRLGPASDIAKQGVLALGEKTGAFGIKPRQKHGKKTRSAKPMHPDHGFMPYGHFYGQPQIASNFSPMLGAQHPAMWPLEPSLPDIGGAMKKRRGGSFRPS